MLTSEGVRAAVPEPLATATVRAAARLAIGGATSTGVVSASALVLTNAVLRAAAVFRLKVAAAILLAIAVAGAALGAGARGGFGVRDPSRDPDTGRAPAVALHPAANPAADHRPADEIVQEIEAARTAAAELLLINQVDLRLMPKVKDLSALPMAGRNLIIVAGLDRGLYLRMFDVHGRMVLDSVAKRFTSTWVEYLRQLVPTLWPPHEPTHTERISVIHAVRQIAHSDWHADMQRAHGRLASLVGELRAAYPHDPRVAHYLPERWDAIARFGERGVLGPELREVLETTRDPALRTNALYFQTSIRLWEPIDGRTAASLAESFAAQAPGDNRAAELLFLATHKLGAEWSTLVVLAAAFAVTAGLVAATIGMRRWLKYVVRVGVVLLALFAVVVVVSFFRANDVLIATIRHLDEKINGGSALAMVLPAWIGPGTFAQLRVLAGTLGAAFAVTLAALSGVLLIAARRRFAAPPTRRLSAIRLGIVMFFAVLAAFCAVDACLIGFQRNAIRARIVRDYPDSSPGQKTQQQRRQHKRIGARFEPAVDEVTRGFHVSMKNLHGNVVGWSRSCRYRCARTPLPSWERSPAQRAGEGAELPATHV